MIYMELTHLYSKTSISSTNFDILINLNIKVKNQTLLTKGKINITKLTKPLLYNIIHQKNILIK